MKKVSEILATILAIAKDVKIWFRVFVLVVTGFAGAILFSRTKVKLKDCTFCEEQKTNLINALINIKTMDATVLVGSNVMESAVFMESDTTPKHRKISRYIDSVLRQIKIDSIKKSKN